MDEKQTVRRSVSIDELTKEEKEIIKKPRERKLLVCSSGGTAGGSSYHYKIGIPTFWARMIGVSKENRDIVMFFREDEKEIVIVKKEDFDKNSNNL